MKWPKRIMLVNNGGVLEARDTRDMKLWEPKDSRVYVLAPKRKPRAAGRKGRRR